MSINCMNSKIAVALRVRPEVGSNEIGHQPCLVASGDKEIQVTVSNIGAVITTAKVFSFDNVFAGSADENSQESIYLKVGQPIVSKALNGYNCSIFAYGQTGSGKSYTMFGIENDIEREGLIPRICRALIQVTHPQPNTDYTKISTLSQVTDIQSNGIYSVMVSYIEVYMERVRDLLSDNDDDTFLRVREHPVTGTYVEGAKTTEVKSYDELRVQLANGTKRRTSANTKANENSSRSHAVFTIILTNTVATAIEDRIKTSKVHLVDLAGSENSKSAGLAGIRLKEAACINKSLLTLGRVIQLLVRNAKMSSTKLHCHTSTLDANQILKIPSHIPRCSRHKVLDPNTVSDNLPLDMSTHTLDSTYGGGISGSDETEDLCSTDDFADETERMAASSTSSIAKSHVFDTNAPSLRIPYRESTLTYLLKESLGGNSITTIIATVRPESFYLEESLSTLRFAMNATILVNNTSVNYLVLNKMTMEQMQKHVKELEADLARARERQAELDRVVNDGFQTESSKAQATLRLLEIKDERDELQNRVRDLESELFSARERRTIQNSKLEVTISPDLVVKNEQLEAALRDLIVQQDQAEELLEEQEERIKGLQMAQHEREEEFVREQQTRREQQIQLLTNMRQHTTAGKASSHSSLPSIDISDLAVDMYVCLSERKQRLKSQKLEDLLSSSPTCDALNSSISQLIPSVTTWFSNFSSSSVSSLTDDKIK